MHYNQMFFGYNIDNECKVDIEVYYLYNQLI